MSFMSWIFPRTLPHGSSPVHSGNHASDPLYVARPAIENAIGDALSHSESFVIYGPPHLGKTAVLNHHLAGAEAVHIECCPGFKRTQIYRVMLSGVGYAVLVKKSKKGKASTTVKFGLGAMGATGGAEGEVEQMMEAVTVDLRNPSEVAHLISRMKHLPWIVLNNFQLLDLPTKRNLLFDLSFLTERPGIRFIIVGDWSHEEYLEEIEPAISGKFRYVHVPPWSETELRNAAGEWAKTSNAADVIQPHLDEFLALAAGDISLFRALIGAFLGRPVSGFSSLSVASVERMVVGRFRRGLVTKLRSIFAEKNIYVRYRSLCMASSFVANRKFRKIPNATENDYARTNIDPKTHRPYPNGREMLLDRSGNPQFIEKAIRKVVNVKTDIAHFLLRQFHNAAHQEQSEIELAQLVRSFGQDLAQKPVNLDETRLKEVFLKFDEVQRRALIMPPMLVVRGDKMEIADHRLFLFLRSLSSDDLEELLEDVKPREVPKIRRRNRLSPRLRNETEAAFIKRAMDRQHQLAAAVGSAEEAPKAPRAVDGTVSKVDTKNAEPKKRVVSTAA